MLKFQIKLVFLFALVISLGCFAMQPGEGLANILTVKVTPKVLDKLWSAYYTTNKPIYIKRILEFINQDNTLLLIGYEITNRNYICQVMQQIKFKERKQSEEALSQVCGKNALKDLIAATKRKYPKSYKQKFSQAITVSAAIWSLELNQRQNKTVAIQVNKIIADNPSLDYWKKI